MKNLCIIQARTGSTRLPNKILYQIKNKPVLWYCVERTLKAKTLDKVVVATTVEERDDVVVQLCQEYQWDFFRGSEADVLDRYYQCAKQYNPQNIIRITSDCPLIDPEIIDQTVNYFVNHDYEIVRNTWFKDAYPSGFDVEVYRFDLLKKYWETESDSKYREHVIGNQSQFKLKQYANLDSKLIQAISINYNLLHLSVDTIEDLKLVTKVIEHFENLEFTFEDVINYLNRHPNLISNLTTTMIEKIKKIKHLT